MSSLLHDPVTLTPRKESPCNDWIWGWGGPPRPALALFPLQDIEHLSVQHKVCARSLAGIVGSNPAGDIDFCLLWLLRFVRWRSVRRADPSCDHESATIRMHWPTRGCCAMVQIIARGVYWNIKITVTKNKTDSRWIVTYLIRRQRIKKPNFWNGEPASAGSTLTMVALRSGGTLKLYSDVV
jgi:hypothetical protein